MQQTDMNSKESVWPWSKAGGRKTVTPGSNPIRRRCVCSSVYTFFYLRGREEDKLDSPPQAWPGRAKVKEQPKGKTKNGNRENYSKSRGEKKGGGNTV